MVFFLRFPIFSLIAVVSIEPLQQRRQHMKLLRTNTRDQH